MSDIVDVMGYKTTSGSKPRLKEITETASVRGGIKRTDRPMVAIITVSISIKSVKVAFQKNMPKIEVPSPIMTPLTSAKTMTERKSK